MVSCPQPHILFSRTSLSPAWHWLPGPIPQAEHAAQRVTGSVERQEGKVKFQLATSTFKARHPLLSAPLPLPSQRAPASASSSTTIVFVAFEHVDCSLAQLADDGSYLMNDLRPVLKKASICSRDLPLVSGTQQPVNKMFAAQMTTKNRKGTSRPKTPWKVGQKADMS